MIVGGSSVSIDTASGIFSLQPGGIMPSWVRIDGDRGKYLHKCFFILLCLSHHRVPYDGLERARQASCTALKFSGEFSIFRLPSGTAGEWPASSIRASVLVMFNTPRRPLVLAEFGAYPLFPWSLASHHGGLSSRYFPICGLARICNK